MKYNLWHIELYHGYKEIPTEEDCNIIDDFIFDSKFTKEQIENMMVSLYQYDDTVEIFNCVCIKSNQNLWLSNI